MVLRFQHPALEADHLVPWATRDSQQLRFLYVTVGTTLRSLQFRIPAHCSIVARDTPGVVSGIVSQLS
jgi:hypothetical protein